MPAPNEYPAITPNPDIAPEPAPSPVQPTTVGAPDYSTPPTFVPSEEVGVFSTLPHCSPAVTCPGTDNPILNLSSEDIDEFVYIGMNWGPYTPPPVLNTYIDQGCLGTCESVISQEDADLCAARQAIFCVKGGGNNPGTPPPTLICNDPQSATVLCPDGLPFTYTVPAGVFCGESKTLLNEQAHSYAQRLAASQKVCLGSLQRCACINVPYSGQIPISGNFTGQTHWSLSSGILPPGLFLSQTGVISGTPLISGTYSFEVMATTSAGTYMQKPYTIVILEITTTSLPPYTVGTPYSFQLQAAGGSGNYAWKIASGALPNGLTMSVTGLISGTPT